MDAPKFQLGQRVYNRANPYHGKVTQIFATAETGGWVYTILLDQPNPTNESHAYYGESGLCISLENAVQWQKEQGPMWKCLKCPVSNPFLAQSCAQCGSARPSSGESP